MAVKYRKRSFSQFSKNGERFIFWHQRLSSDWEKGITFILKEGEVSFDTASLEAEDRFLAYMVQGGIFEKKEIGIGVLPVFWSDKGQVEEGKEIFPLIETIDGSVSFSKEDGNISISFWTNLKTLPESTDGVYAEYNNDLVVHLSERSCDFSDTNEGKFYRAFCVANGSLQRIKRKIEGEDEEYATVPIFSRPKILAVDEEIEDVPIVDFICEEGAAGNCTCLSEFINGLSEVSKIFCKTNEVVDEYGNYSWNKLYLESLQQSPDTKNFSFYFYKDASRSPESLIGQVENIDSSLFEKNLSNGEITVSEVSESGVGGRFVVSVNQSFFSEFAKTNVSTDSKNCAEYKTDWESDKENEIQDAKTALSDCTENCQEAPSVAECIKGCPSDKVKPSYRKCLENEIKRDFLECRSITLFDDRTISFKRNIVDVYGQIGTVDTINNLWDFNYSRDVEKPFNTGSDWGTIEFRIECLEGNELPVEEQRTFRIDIFGVEDSEEVKIGHSAIYAKPEEGEFEPQAVTVYPDAGSGISGSVFIEKAVRSDMVSLSIGKASGLGNFIARLGWMENLWAFGETVWVSVVSDKKFKIGIFHKPLSERLNAECEGTQGAKVGYLVKATTEIQGEKVVEVLTADEIVDVPGRYGIIASNGSGLSGFVSVVVVPYSGEWDVNCDCGCSCVECPGEEDDSDENSCYAIPWIDTNEPPSSVDYAGELYLLDTTLEKAVEVYETKIEEMKANGIGDELVEEQLDIGGDNSSEGPDFSRCFSDYSSCVGLAYSGAFQNPPATEMTRPEPDVWEDEAGNKQWWSDYQDLFSAFSSWQKEEQAKLDEELNTCTSARSNCEGEAQAKWSEENNDEQTYLSDDEGTTLDWDGTEDRQVKDGVIWFAPVKMPSSLCKEIQEGGNSSVPKALKVSLRVPDCNDIEALHKVTAEQAIEWRKQGINLTDPATCVRKPSLVPSEQCPYPTEGWGNIKVNDGCSFLHIFAEKTTVEGVFRCDCEENYFLPCPRIGEACRPSWSCYSGKEVVADGRIYALEAIYRVVLGTNFPVENGWCKSHVFSGWGDNVWCRYAESCFDPYTHNIIPSISPVLRSCIVKFDTRSFRPDGTIWKSEVT